MKNEGNIMLNTLISYLEVVELPSSPQPFPVPPTGFDNSVFHTYVTRDGTSLSFGRHADDGRVRFSEVHNRLLQVASPHLASSPTE